MAVEMFDQFAGCDHAPGVVHQVAQAAEFERRQVDRHVVDREAHPAGIETDGADGEHGRSPPGGPAQERAHAGRKLLHGERLGEVVVGPGVDALDALRPGAAGGQDQHREVALRRAPLLEDG